jgi:hypothetical protein
MRNLGKLADQAKRIVDQRGGVEALKEDARELRDIARGEGTAKEKAKRAAEALKDPGARGDRTRPDAGATPPGSPERPSSS